MLMPSPNSASPTMQRAKSLHGSVGEAGLHARTTTLRDGRCHTLLVLIATMFVLGSSPLVARHTMCVLRMSVGEALCHRCRFSLASRRRRRRSDRSPDGIRAAFPFEGVARELIVALKFRHRRSAAARARRAHGRRLRLTDDRRGHVGADQCPSRPQPRLRPGRGDRPTPSLASSVCRAVGCSIGSHGAPADRQVARRATGRPGVPGPSPTVAASRCCVVDDVVTTGATCAPRRKPCSGGSTGSCCRGGQHAAAASAASTVDESMHAAEPRRRQGQAHRR